MNYAVILSGGIGVRLGANIPKQYIDVCGKPIIQYTLEVFCKCRAIDKIVVVAAEGWRDSIEDVFSRCSTKHYAFADAGASRQESIFNGLIECMKDAVSPDDNVIIHDAVRPLIDVDFLTECLEGLASADAVMPALPVNDTIYLCRNEYVEGLLDRDALMAGQSPEAFKLQKYYEWNKNLSASDRAAVRGSSELAYQNGAAVKVIHGRQNNFKITTVADIKRLETILEDRK